MTKPHDSSLARTLILDEIFDLALYRALRDISEGKIREILEELIKIEITHITFWQKFFDSRLTSLDFARRVKLQLIVLICRLFGAPAIHLVLEAIEVYGVKKYLSVWKTYKDEPLGAAVKGILMDEFKHEDLIVTQLAERKINPEKIRNIFLGLNDGLVEILGAVSGFFAAFGDTVTVLIAGSTTAVAGSLSMAAGAYVALSSEREVKTTEEDKKRFLGEPIPDEGISEPPLGSSFVVGGSYFAGATVPLLPILFGAKDALASLLMAGSVIIVVSMALAFLSGMDIKKRIMTNLVIVAFAVGLTYAIGLIAKQVWGIPL
ncbi:MAG: VIT1/CCC1 transporter family protein [Nitrospiraceae bacterium]